MEFDIKSMKEREKEFMRVVKPSHWTAGAIFGGLGFLYAVLSFYLMSHNKGLIWLVIGLVYINIRKSRDLYCLKMAREESVILSDVFLAYKKNPVTFFVIGIIQDISYIIGSCVFGIGILVPIYLFRFSAFVAGDGERNPLKALNESRKLLKGHYKELIKLDISNLGWFFLKAITGGLSDVYTSIYVTLVYAEFYDYLKGQKELFES
ncbi:MAG: DUF975 family protein [Clostridiales bacterium]|nr:DUF975 family protein [Clostridiales bacterium]